MRKIAPWTPICFVPNGVDLAPFDDLPPRAELEAECPELAGKFVLLFFARVHVKKGLDLLAEALGQIAPDYPELHLVLAGNDDGALSPFRDRMAELGLTRRMTYLGHVAGERARQVWAAADAFVLPSYSEGFSMAILEALACRLPCLITTACHFPEAAAAGGGRRRQPDSDCRHPRPARAARTHARRARPARPERPPARRGALHLGPPGRAPRRRLRLARRRWGAAGGCHPLTGDLGPDPLLRFDLERTTMQTTFQIDRRRSFGPIQPAPRAGKAPVSVIVPVKNEAENLRRCLPALAWADEVFVVDSQSTDETEEVAAASGATVVQFHFNGTYPKKKNWALDNLPFRNEWVLIVDADEVVVPELADEIARRIARNEADGFYLNSHYYFLGRRIRHCGYASCWNLRLFKHRLGRYEKMPDCTGGRTGDNEAHEHVELEGRVLRLDERARASRLPHDRHLGREAQPLRHLGGRGERAIPQAADPEVDRQRAAVQAPAQEDRLATAHAPARPLRLCLRPAARLPRRKTRPRLLRSPGLLRLPGFRQPLRTANRQKARAPESGQNADAPSSLSLGERAGVRAPAKTVRDAIPYAF